MSSASCALFLSSQKRVGILVAFALVMASLTQSWIGASLTWHILHISPVSTLCSIRVVPVFWSITDTVPLEGISKVLSCEPYSSAFCAISPTLGTVPMVVGSKAPCSLQNFMVSLYTP